MAVWPGYSHVPVLDSVRIKPYQKPLQTNMGQNNIRSRSRPGDNYAADIQMTVPMPGEEWQTFRAWMLTNGKSLITAFPCWDGEKFQTGRTILFTEVPEVTAWTDDYALVPFTFRCFDLAA